MRIFHFVISSYKRYITSQIMPSRFKWRIHQWANAVFLGITNTKNTEIFHKERMIMLKLVIVCGLALVITNNEVNAALGVCRT